MKKTMKWAIYKTHIRNYEEILGTRNLKRGMVLWLGKTAKSLFIFLFFFFFLFLFGLTTQERSVGKCYMTNIIYHSHMSRCHSFISHDECGKVVHRPCSSCISSVQNQIRTLLSSPCQSGLRVWLSHLRLSCYRSGQHREVVDEPVVEVGEPQESLHISLIF